VENRVKPTEFINAFRANFFKEEVFIITPKGDLKKLPNGSTVLDFAFEIHTEFGKRCLGAKVNQKLDSNVMNPIVGY
jgi:GTP pyrophosphokinase